MQYTRAQLLGVRDVVCSNATVDLGIAKGVTSSRATPLVVKKPKVGSATPQPRAASAGDALSAAKVVPPPATASSQVVPNVWEQRKLIAQEKKAQEVRASKQHQKVDEAATSTPTPTEKLSSAEDTQTTVVSSFSTADRAKLAQLREHLKTRTLASGQLRPGATEFRPAGTDSHTQDPTKKHWSRHRSPEKTAPAKTKQQASPNNNKQATAKTPVKDEEGHVGMTVVGYDDATASKFKKTDARSCSPSKRRVPPPRTIGQLRQREAEDLPVDFRHLIPTTDITGKTKPLEYKEQLERMRKVAKILVNKGKKRAYSAEPSRSKSATAKMAPKKTKGTTTTTSANGVTTITTKASTPIDLIDQLNARANAGPTEVRLPTFREHQATRAASAIVRPAPGPSKAEKEAAAKDCSNSPTSPVQAETDPTNTANTDTECWEKYIPNLKEFPEDYAVLFADWCHADLQTENKMHMVTEDVKLLADFQPAHLEVVHNPDTNLDEEYTMMWVEGVYRQVPVALVTPEMIRKSREAAKVYEGVDTQNLSLKRAFIAHKKTLPAERKQRKETREAEVDDIRKKIQPVLETGLDTCDRKAAEMIRLSEIMRDPKLDGLTIEQKCDICRARRIRFLKGERLAMVEKVAAQNTLQVLDVIAVLHSMMSDRVNQKSRKIASGFADDIRFARMLVKADQRNIKLAHKEDEEEVEEAEEGAKKEKKKTTTADAPNGEPTTLQDDELLKRVSIRRKQIQMAMRTPGFQIWEKVKDSKDPKYKVKLPVSTPVPEQLCSKRSWDGIFRQWRQRLHQYDTFALEVLGRKVFDKEDVDAHRLAKVAAIQTPVANGNGNGVVKA